MVARRGDRSTEQDNRQVLGHGIRVTGPPLLAHPEALRGTLAVTVVIATAFARRSRLGPNRSRPGASGGSRSDDCPPRQKESGVSPTAIRNVVIVVALFVVPIVIGNAARQVAEDARPRLEVRRGHRHAGGRGVLIVARRNQARSRSQRRHHADLRNGRNARSARRRRSRRRQPGAEEDRRLRISERTKKEPKRSPKTKKTRQLKQEAVRRAEPQRHDGGPDQGA